jgi:hypothetical protein
MSTNKERYAALLRVVEFAKANGFPKAHAAFWDPDDAETGHTDEEEILDNLDPGDHTIDIGIFLDSSIRFQKKEVENPRISDDMYTYGPTEGEAP